MKKITLIIILIIIIGAIWWWQQKTKDFTDVITVEQCHDQSGKEYNSYPLCPDGMEYFGRITELKGSNWSCCK